MGAGGKKQTKKKLLPQDFKQTPTAMSLMSHLILQSLYSDFVHTEFNGGFRFDGTHIAVWIGTI